MARSMDQLREIAAQLGIDETFYPIFGTLVALYFLLSPIYLKPFQKLILKRKERTEGEKEAAQKMIAQADEKFAQYKERFRTAVEGSKAVLKKAEDEARKEETKILGAASDKAKAALQSAQTQLESERKAALTALQSDISGIATEVASKVLGRPVAAR